MGGFKSICCKCGSNNILEKSGQKMLDWIGDSAIYGEGIQRKCTECDNESFVIFKTWVQKKK